MSLGATEDVEGAATDKARGGLSRFLGLRHDQRVAFIGVGAFNTAFGALVFAGLELTLGRVAGYMIVLLIAHVIAVICAFFMHRRFVFRVQGNVLVDLMRFETVYLGALVINAVLLPLLVEVGGLPVIPSQFLIVGVTAVISFFGHRHFSFRRPGQS
jgi:putative flippase GtrA